MSRPANHNPTRPDKATTRTARNKATAGAYPPWTRADTRILAVILLVAMAVRVTYVLELRSCPYFDQETMDAGYHDEWARAIAAGRSFVDGPYFRAPLYPWFLGVLYRITHVNYLAVRMVQAVLGALSCGLVYLIGRRLMPRVAAAGAAIACALYWTLVYFDAELLIPVVAVFLDLLLILLMVRVAQRRRVADCVMGGLVLGCSALARPNILLFAPVLVIWMGLLPPRRRAGLAAAGAFAVAAGLVILPVTAYNISRGDRVLISSQAGVNFFIGNNAEADGMRVHVPGLRPSIREIYEGTTRIAEEHAHRSLKPSEVSRFYFGEAFDWMRHHPRQAVGLMLRKLRYFWSRSEILNNKNIYFLTDRYTPIIRCLPVGFWLVGPLGLMGMVAAMRSPRMLPLWGFVLVYMISVVLFFVTARFRVPVVAVLALLAAYGVHRAVAAVRERNWPRVAVLSAVLVPAVVLVAQPAQDRNKRTLAEVALVDLSKALYKKGRTDEAITLLTEATDSNPHYAEALYSLGVAYTNKGDLKAAERAYKRAIQADPRNVSAHNNLGRLYLDQKRYDEAIPLLTRAVQLDASHSGARFNLGKALQAVGRSDEAIAAYRSGLALRPDRVDIIGRLVNLLMRQHRYDEAAATLDRALTAHPDSVGLLIQEVRVRAMADDGRVLDCGRARRAADRAAKLTHGTDARVLGALAAAHAQCGEWPACIQAAKQAVTLARAAGDQDLAERLSRRLQSYRRREPYRIGGR